MPTILFLHPFISFLAKAWGLPYRATSTRSWHAFSFRWVLDWVLWVIPPVETRHFWMNTHRPWSLSRKMLRGSGKYLQSRLRMTAKLAPASLQLSIVAWKPCCRSGMSEWLHGIIFVRPLIRWTWISWVIICAWLIQRMHCWLRCSAMEEVTCCC